MSGITSRQFIFIAELAEMFGVSQRTAERWIAKGIVPSIRVGGRRFVDLRELEALIAKANNAAPPVTEDDDGTA